MQQIERVGSYDTAKLCASAYRLEAGVCVYRMSAQTDTEGIIQALQRS